MKNPSNDPVPRWMAVMMPVVVTTWFATGEDVPVPCSAQMGVTWAKAEARINRSGRRVA
jgi:hypothetical protein